jgi:hypothetical protein
MERAKGFEPSTPTLARLQNSYSVVAYGIPELYDLIVFSLILPSGVRYKTQPLPLTVVSGWCLVS